MENEFLKSRFFLMFESFIKIELKNIFFRHMKKIKKV